MERILVCGLNGAGKSTVGRMLAERRKNVFIDIEDLYSLILFSIYGVP